MRVKLIKIGNSMGVRLPHSIIKDCGFGEDVELNVRHKSVILTPVTAERSAWKRQVSEDVLLKPVTSAKGEWMW